MRLLKCDRIKYSAEGNRCRVPWIDCTGTEQEVFITPLGVRYERPGRVRRSRRYRQSGLIPGFR
jgi:hypothetical protein